MNLETFSDKFVFNFKTIFNFWLSDEEVVSDGDGDECDKKRFSKLFEKGKAKKNRKGRKCQWKKGFVDDLVNTIVENEK